MALRSRLLALTALMAAGAAHADTVLVAVAANFTGTLQALATGFEQQTGHRIQQVSGSTGKLYAQIKNGAPFEVLLAADDIVPGQLEQEGLGVAGSRFTYAVGRLVLWSARPDLVDKDGAVLSKGGFAHLAVAKPALAPYGQAAMEVLARLKLKDQLSTKLVEGENIGQTYQFIVTGNAELGFVARAQVFKDGKLTTGSAWLVPSLYHVPLRQDVVLLLPGKDRPAAQAFLKYLKGDKARAVMQSFGYE
ncbi:MAG: molybdate ABC transporter substrate-binding protein [Burkholderiales bacterium]|nr:molybdate ABC transporter substrate-binding protein [Burkholderiales bacterium]